MPRITATPREVRKFGFTFSILSLGLALVLLYKGNSAWTWVLAAALFFLLTGLFLFSTLKPIYIGWMTFAQALAWLNTRIFLGIIFFLIFAPAGILLRLLRKDALRLRLDKQMQTYWVKRSPYTFDKKSYERLF